MGNSLALYVYLETRYTYKYLVQKHKREQEGRIIKINKIKKRSKRKTEAEIQTIALML